MRREVPSAVGVALLATVVACTGVAWPTPGRAAPIPEIRDPLELNASGRDQPTGPNDLSRAEREVAPFAILPGPVDSSAYFVGPGDILTLSLWGKVTRSVPLEVSPEGTITLPGAGTMRVSGKTLAEVRQELLRRVGAEFRGVNADVRLTRARTFIVYLSGEVRNPGPRPATGAGRVGDLLTLDGLTERASKRNIELRHRDGTREYADLALFLASGDANVNPWLRDGDIIYVPVAIEFIHAEGAVARPGRYELGTRDSLLTLLRLAGDPLPATDVDKALLVRWKNPYEPESSFVSIQDVYARKFNPVMRDGDRIFVYYIPRYHEQHQATILGEVNRPGTYPIAEGVSRLSDMVRWAAGFQPTADLNAIRIHRTSAPVGERDEELERMLRLPKSELSTGEYASLRTKLAGLREDYRVDWARLKAEGGALDLLLRDGDIVRVNRLVSSIRVDGEVRHPGVIEFRPGHKLEDYIAEAGGYGDRAWKGKVRVTRGVTGQTILAKDVRQLNPEKSDSRWFDRSVAIIGVAGSLAAIALTIDALAHH